MTRSRRAIALFVAAAALAPYGLGARAPKTASRASALFDLIEALPAGARVLVSFDYSPAFAAECQPAADAILWHLFARGCRAYLMTLWPAGEDAAARTLERVLADGLAQKQYARDYIVLGLKPGGVGAINALARDLRAFVTADAAGAVIDEFEMTNGIARLADFDLVVTISAGEPGAKEWAQCAGSLAGARVAAAVAAIDAPALLPYVPGQIAALSIGILGAARHESALSARYATRNNGPSRSRAASQSALHAAIVALTASGAVAAARRRGQRPGRRDDRS
ncbi:MAG: hypothetical protein ACKVU1_17365 [bacterium]